MNKIPEHLLRDRFWKSMIHIFENHGKLQGLFTTKYFDFEAELVKVRSLKSTTKGWSQSEKFMLDLALHLYNSSNKVDLSDMDCLDPYNTKIALEAIQMRYGS